MIESLTNFTKSLDKMGRGTQFCAVFVMDNGEAGVERFMKAVHEAGLGAKLAVLFSLEQDRVFGLDDWRRRLTNEDPNIRQEAAEMLGNVTSSEDISTFAWDLIEALRDNSEAVRDAALASLVKLAPLEVLIQALGDQDSERRHAAAWAIGHLGEQARDAVPALIDSLRDDNDSVRKTAAWALERVFTNTPGAQPDTSSARRRSRRQRRQSSDTRRVRWDIIRSESGPDD